MKRFLSFFFVILMTLGLIYTISTSQIQAVESIATNSPIICNTSTQVCIDLSLRLQGILKKPVSPLNTITMDVTLQGGDVIQEPQTKTITLTAGSNGIWTGKVQYENVFVSETTASNFKLTMKPPHHLKRIICTNNPIEFTAGSYTCPEEGPSMTLELGTNTLDLSRIYFLSGDLPFEGGQNGVINAEDIVYLRNSIGSQDEDVQLLADLNRDTIVDTQDLSLAVYTLTVTNVDEDIVLF